jgi:hypothetical protein
MKTILIFKGDTSKIENFQKELCKRGMVFKYSLPEYIDDPQENDPQEMFDEIEELGDCAHNSGLFRDINNIIAIVSGNVDEEWAKEELGAFTLSTVEDGSDFVISNDNFCNIMDILIK